MGNTQGGLPYNVGEACPSYTSKQGWTLYQGTSKADKSPCSIFKFDPKNAGGNTTASAQNALKMAKTMKHPNVLRCLDGVETPSGEILIVVEPVVPLLDWLLEVTVASAVDATATPDARTEARLSAKQSLIEACEGTYRGEAVQGDIGLTPR